jgi:hypothetical protein
MGPWLLSNVILCERERVGHSLGSPVFVEHSMVRLSRACDTDDGRTLPAGASGAVVGIWREGLAYEVEFSDPFHAVVTLRPQQLQAA